MSATHADFAVSEAVRSPIPVSSSRAAMWGGRVASGIAALFLAFDGVFKLVQPAEALESTVHLGYPGTVLWWLGVVEVVLLALYLLPRTAVFGALLWTGYLGGAIATHVRVGNPWLSHILFPTYVAALLWGGLWLRNARLRQLLPFTR